MLTLVTDGATKSGPVISGTVVGVAVVATDDGYASNPGHAGTGTILSYSPCTGDHSGGGDGGPTF